MRIADLRTLEYPIIRIFQIPLEAPGNDKKRNQLAALIVSSPFLSRLFKSKSQGGGVERVGQSDELVLGFFFAGLGVSPNLKSNRRIL